MKASLGLKTSLVLMLGLVGIIGTIPSCDSAPAPFLVVGPGVTGNDPPTLTIEAPNVNLTVDQGSLILIGWRDTDQDSNAAISFSLINTATNERITLVSGLDENDTTGLDQVSVGTSLIPFGTYNLLGSIDDGVNAPVEVYAFTAAEAVPQRVVVTVVEPGTGPVTTPPVVTVTAPAFNLSVAQDDVLTVTVQPTRQPPDAALPFDADSEITLYIVLDLDQEPNNDDPSNPDPDQIILLLNQVVQAGAFDPISFDIPVDLSTIPPLLGGEPYYIRATTDDGTNPRVHSYAVGKISVVQLAAGVVDLFDIGRDKSGTRLWGFNPEARLGSSLSGVGDFDADGVDDFVAVAKTGNPRNAGLVGEAYLIYGQDQIRFGGAIGVNSVSEAISGVIFEAPPERNNPDMSDGAPCIIPGTAFSAGITDVNFVPDLSGDGRPEILFSLPHVHGAFEAMDFDPGDQDVAASDDTTDVDIRFRTGSITLDGNQINQTYTGIEDVTIDSSEPNLSFGSEQDLSWVDGGAGNRKWALIKFSDILLFLPDDPFFIDPQTMTATLEMRVFNTGIGADVFEALTGFNEQTTFATFAINGGEPEPGVDYLLSGPGDGTLDTVTADTAEVVTADVTDLVQLLFDGVLVGNELSLIFIASGSDEDLDDEASVRSSEFSVGDNRPSLRIEYTKQNALGARGCYDDPYANNKTDDTNTDDFDYQFTAGGMVVMVDSGNRDNSPRITPIPERLDTTTVALELAGQQAFTLDGGGVNMTGGSITPRCDNYDELGRVAGARFMGGHFDCIDHRLTNQPARNGSFGQSVAPIGDLNNDNLNEIVISAPKNEAYLQDLRDTFGGQSTHVSSTGFEGSIAVLPGANYSAAVWREKPVDDDSNGVIPSLDQQRNPPFGRCQPSVRREILVPSDAFEVFAEDRADMLGDGRSAGDFNLDGLDDILCGAPKNDLTDNILDTGATYVLYGRNILGDFDLKNADNPLTRTPMLRIRGETPGDQVGWRQAAGLDVNGDRVDDVFIASPWVDYGSVIRSRCARDFDGDGVLTSEDLLASDFSDCRSATGDEVFTDDACVVFDYDRDGDIDDEDEQIFFCVADGDSDCCDNLVDNGFVGVIFGGVFTDGDRTLSDIATPDLPGTIFFGAAAGYHAGMDVSSAGDFNQDGFGDLLIAVPGETRIDRAGRERLGVVYLVFGGTHLHNSVWSLDQVGSDDLPGIIFLSPYTKGKPNEAAPTTVAFIGDINNDGFGDIAIGNPKADFIDTSFPQDSEGDDPGLGRRRNAGDAYIVYGNNFGTNRGAP